ncbi:MAG: TonB-dependent receptor [Dechloromonas sp.]|nr:MAG: TonB-dependent receptor [Dechloromonas sp.]
MKNISEYLLRILFAAAFLGLGATSGFAGAISGRIFDINTRSSVTGAVITETTSGRKVTADREGRFRLDDLPEGALRLEVEALGYESKAFDIEVPKTGAVTTELALGDDKAIQLDALVIEGYREGWAKALQQKQNSTNLREVLSSDAAGKLPDNNIGEALSRLPGVSLRSDYGEGNFISIRGTSPGLNSVTMNGVPLATAPDLGRDGRSTPMYLLGTGLINQVEVIKTLTPDMEGTSLGGTINLHTPSGFDHKDRFIGGAIQYGENAGTKKPIQAADFTYSNIFGTADDAIAVALALNYEKRHTRRDSILGFWAGTAAAPRLTEPRINRDFHEREKYGLTFNLERRTSAGSELYLRTFFNNFQSFNDRDQHLNSSAGTPTFLSARRVSYPQIRPEVRKISAYRESELFTAIAGGSRLLGEYKVSAETSYSFAPDRQDAYRNFAFRGGNITVPGGYVLDFEDFYPKYNVTDIVNNLNTPIRRFRGDSIDNLEETATARVDVEREFADLFKGKRGSLKFGFKYSYRNRDIKRDVRDNTVPGLVLSDVDPSAIASTPSSVFDGRYVLPLEMNDQILRAAYERLRSEGKLVLNTAGSLSNAGEDIYQVIERVPAVYGMIDLEISEQLSVLAGARYEYTKAPLNGYRFQETNGVAELLPRKVDIDYDQLLPNLQARYKISNNTLARAAVTKTYGRAAYSDQVPTSNFDNSGGSLTTGNPDLDPYESLNLDLALEHYFTKGGLVSLAIFHKTIDNPIYTFSTVFTDYTFEGSYFPVFTFSNKQNADSAKLKGVEAALVLPFSLFTHGFADGFGIEVNGSYNDSDVKVPTRPGEQFRLFESPEKIFNAAVYYDKYGFSARIAYNYQSDSLATIGATTFHDVFNEEYFTWDAQIGYRISENYSFFINWQNLTDEKVITYVGSRDRINEAQWFGSNVRAGIRVRF